jgi:FtsH-binding integral membrane protein
MRAYRRARRFTRELLRWLALVLYVSSGAALLFAVLGYLFALSYYGESVGFVYGLAVHALRIGLLLLALGVCLHIAAAAGRGGGR